MLEMLSKGLPASDPRRVAVVMHLMARLENIRFSSRDELHMGEELLKVLGNLDAECTLERLHQLVQTVPETILEWEWGAEQQVYEGSNPWHPTLARAIAILESREMS
jgi:hypothetical protein